MAKAGVRIMNVWSHPFGHYPRKWRPERKAWGQKVEELREARIENRKETKVSTVRYTVWLEHDTEDEAVWDKVAESFYTLPGYVEHSFEDYR